LPRGWAEVYKTSTSAHGCRGIVARIDPAKRAQRVLDRLGVARARDLEAAGLTRVQIARLTRAGTIERVARGLYRRPGGELSESQGLAEVARRVPRGVVCLLSALRFHGLTTQNPFEVWLAIDRKAWRPVSAYPPLRLFHLTPAALETDVEIHRIDGVPVRVFSAAKTVADCFRFRNKLGVDVAVEALREYKRKHGKRLDALWRAAEAGRVTRTMRPYLEALL